MYVPKNKKKYWILSGKVIRNRIQLNLVLKENNIIAKLESQVFKKLHFQKKKQRQKKSRKSLGSVSEYTPI